MEYLTGNRKGVALLSTLFFLVIVTVVATGALMLSTVQMKVAGSVARWEGAFFASEGAISMLYPLAKDMLYSGAVQLPSPDIQILDANYARESVADPDALIDRIMKDGTIKKAAPDLRYPDFLGYEVVLDLDSIGTIMLGGGSIEGAWAYHGAQMSGGIHTAYRFSSLAETPSKSARSLQKQIMLLPTLR